MEQGSEEDPKEENEIQGLFVLHEPCGLGAKGVCVLDCIRVLEPSLSDFG